MAQVPPRTSLLSLRRALPALRGVFCATLLAAFAVARPGLGEPPPAPPPTAAASVPVAGGTVQSALGASGVPGAGVLDPQKIRAAVAELASDAATWGGTAGAIVVDVATGAVLGSANEHTALTPASNAKLATAAAALTNLIGLRLDLIFPVPGALVLLEAAVVALREEPRPLGRGEVGDVERARGERRGHRCEDARVRSHGATVSALRRVGAVADVPITGTLRSLDLRARGRVRLVGRDRTRLESTAAELGPLDVPPPPSSEQPATR